MKLDMLAATRTIEKTMPFMLYRLLLCLGLGLTFLLATLIGAGTLIAFSSFSKNPSALAGLGAMIGFLGCVYGAYRFRGLWLYTLTARHLAILAAQFRNDTIPEGKAQIGYAKELVAARFASSAALLELDTAISASLHAVSVLHAPLKVANPALQKAIDRLMGGLFASHRQLVLAWHFYVGNDNGWQSAGTAIPCLATHFGVMLKQRLILTAFEWAGFAALYWLMLYPTGLVADALPVAVGNWQYVFAALFAWVLTLAFLQPISTATLMQGFISEVKDEPEQAESLSRESEAFRDIRTRGQ